MEVNIKRFSILTDAEAAFAWRGVQLITVVAVLEAPDDFVATLLTPLATHLSDGNLGSMVIVTESHVMPFVRVEREGTVTDVVVACVAPSILARDDNIERFVTLESNGLKVTRDSSAMRALIIPRLYRYLADFNRDPIRQAAFHSAIEVVIRWGVHRKVVSLTSDNGFLTPGVVAVMMVVTINHATKVKSPLTTANLVRHFFAIFSDWHYNESSLASFCGAVAADYHGTTIEDHEGIDSDGDDPEVRRKRIDKGKRAVVGSPANSLANCADDNDEVHPHKRMRYELGQIRDLRRFYDVENSKVQPICVEADVGKRSITGLDWLDAVTILHPTDDVNLAVRVLESHRKLIVQELLRARNILADSIESDESFLYGEDSELMQDLPLVRESTCYIVFQVEAKSPSVRAIISSVLEDQNWFLIQEVQAHHGCLVTPTPGLVKGLRTIDKARQNEGADGDSGTRSVAVVTGVSFPVEAPYGATAGVKVDLSGPMSRVLMRTRQKLMERPDWSSSLEKQFVLSAGLVRELVYDRPQEE